MHEMALAEGVLQVIEGAAREQSFTRVRTVWLEIGRLAGVEVEAMRFCFDAVMHGSIAQGARLEIVETPGRAQCRECGATVEVQALYDACPECGAYGLRATGGSDMRVKELEVE